MRIDFAAPSDRRSDRVGAGPRREIGEPADVPAILADLAHGNERPRSPANCSCNTVEVVTGVHHRSATPWTDLRGTIGAVREADRPAGGRAHVRGHAPVQPQWFDQEVTPDKERYDDLIDRTRWWGRQMMIWGVHVHVGIDSRDKVLPILNGLLTYFPHLQALTASSPFWGGEKTGYASNRALMFQQLPTAGLPSQFGTWANYEE